ncbi:MAG: histidine kinase N-terminal 7TM domain-containing protein [Anaerolineae bacterium]|nr:histidine kinase N-terminal 7TM domain-containing protein [Anaerolineae bacterium]
MSLDVQFVLRVLSSINLTVASAIVLTAFSLVAYILGHNFRNAVARAFSLLLLFVAVVYCGDVMVANAETPRAIEGWLQFQWLGIAFVPAAYLHFSDALARTTGIASRPRRTRVLVGYALGVLTLAAVLSSDLIVRSRGEYPTLAYLQAGPLFWVFALYFVLATLTGARNIQQARLRALTPATRRRMTYLAVAFVAPALGAFPYLLVASLPPDPKAQVVLESLLFVGNVAVSLMIVVMGYAVAYFGALTPDRVIKHSLIHYLLRGPFVGTCVLALILLTPDTERLLGLPRETFLVFSVTGLIVVLQVLINVSKPFIDRLIYRQDREEILWLQELDNRLLTSSDLAQILENVLTAICEQLRVGGGFVALLSGEGLRLEAVCGSSDRALACLRNLKPDGWALSSPDTPAQNGRRLSLRRDSFRTENGYWLIPLRSKDRQTVLGVLGMEARIYPLAEEEIASLEEMVGQAEIALEDRLLQQTVFAALKQIAPEIQQIQQWRTEPRYAAAPPIPSLRVDAEAAEFRQAVKDALSQLWGGPKLTRNPLIQLRAVSQAMEEPNGNPAKALRQTLIQAVEMLRPEGERSFTAPDWLLYNILEMKFIQRQKTSDIARKLAMSESDLYRKQRVAIEEVAKVLVAMEKEAIRARPAP